MAATKFFQVTNSSVTKHASNLSYSAQDLEAVTKQFIARLEPLNNTWKGISAEAFKGLEGRWAEASAKLVGALANIMAKTGAAGRQYQQGEQAMLGHVTKGAGSPRFDAAVFRGPGA